MNDIRVLHVSSHKNVNIKNLNNYIFFKLYKVISREILQVIYKIRKC